MSKLIGEQEFDEDLTSTFQFEIKKDGKISIWTIDPANKKIIKGGVSDPTCTFSMTDEDFMKLMKKEAEAAELFMTGKLKLELSVYEWILLYESRYIDAILRFGIYVKL